MATIWPFPRIYHVECSGTNLDSLREMAQRHAKSEIAIHLHVYEAEEVLLEWYDAFGGPILLSSRFDQTIAQHFADACGGTLEAIGT